MKAVGMEAGQGLEGQTTVSHKGTGDDPSTLMSWQILSLPVPASGHPSDCS